MPLVSRKYRDKIPHSAFYSPPRPLSDCFIPWTKFIDNLNILFRMSNNFHQNMK